MLFNLLRFGESGIGDDQLFRKNAIPHIYNATSPTGDVAWKKRILNPESWLQPTAYEQAIMWHSYIYALVMRHFGYQLF